MSSDAPHNADTLVCGNVTTDMRGPSPQAAIPGLLDDIVVTYILRSKYFGHDPADLARLRPVSRGMRDAVVATGLWFEELDEEHAVELGCLSAILRLQRGGRLSNQEYICQAAARGGHLEKLKVLREVGFPWNEKTSVHAAESGHLKLMQWLQASSCP